MIKEGIMNKQLRGAVLIGLLVACTGCPNVTTMKLKHSPDGTITIDSGKDVAIGGLTFVKDGVTLDVKNYSSQANTDAIKAQSEREVNMTRAITDAVIQALQAGAAAAAKGVTP